MFDIGWTELALVALVALLVIGPKELPATMRMIAGWIGKVRGLAREFQGGLDEMMREAELDKLKEQAQGMMQGDLDQAVENTIDPDGKIRDELDYSGTYQPFGDFDASEPKPEPKPETKPETKLEAKQAKTAGEPGGAAAVAKTTGKPSKKKASTKAGVKTAAKTSTGTTQKTSAKPAADAGANADGSPSPTTASKPARKSTATATRKAPPRKRASPAKPPSSAQDGSDA